MRAALVARVRAWQASDRAGPDVLTAYIAGITVPAVALA